MSKLIITPFRPFDQTNRLVKLVLTTDDGFIHVMNGAQPILHDVEHLLCGLGFSEDEERKIDDLFAEPNTDIYFKLSEQDKYRYKHSTYNLEAWLNLFTVWSVPTPYTEELDWYTDPPLWFEIVVTLDRNKVVVKRKYIRTLACIAI